MERKRYNLSRGEGNEGCRLQASAGEAQGRPLSGWTVWSQQQQVDRGKRTVSSSSPSSLPNSTETTVAKLSDLLSILTIGTGVPCFEACSFIASSVTVEAALQKKRHHYWSAVDRSRALGWRLGRDTGVLNRKAGKGSPAVSADEDLLNCTTTALT